MNKNTVFFKYFVFFAIIAIMGLTFSSCDESDNDNDFVPIDTIPPAVVSTVPADAAVNVPVSVGKIEIIFSEVINLDAAPTWASLNALGFKFGTTVSGNESASLITTALYDNSVKKLSLELNDLALGTTYHLTIAGIKDIAGNVMVSKVISFTTAGAITEMYLVGEINAWALPGIPMIELSAGVFTWEGNLAAESTFKFKLESDNNWSGNWLQPSVEIIPDNTSVIIGENDVFFVTGNISSNWKIVNTDYYFLSVNTITMKMTVTCAKPVITDIEIKAAAPNSLVVTFNKPVTVNGAAPYGFALTGDTAISITGNSIENNIVNFALDRPAIPGEEIKYTYSGDVIKSLTGISMDTVTTPATITNNAGSSQLGRPSNAVIATDGNVSWTAVTDAVSYTVNLYKESGATDTLVYTYSPAISGTTNVFDKIRTSAPIAGNYFITVIAVAADQNNNSIESLPSSVKTVRDITAIGLVGAISTWNLPGEPLSSDGGGLFSIGAEFTNDLWFYFSVNNAASNSVGLLIRSTAEATVSAGSTYSYLYVTSVQQGWNLNIAGYYYIVVDIVAETITLTMPQEIVSVTIPEGNVSVRKDRTFQFSAAVNRGNSGGPIYNSDGEVIGIVTAKVVRGNVEGIGFAIPINDAIEIASELIEHGYISGRPLLGITVQPVSEANADYFNWVVGIYVMSVNKDSAAENTGILVGDIITALNGVDIDTVEGLREELRKFKAGDTTTITIWRTGESIDLKITFDEDKYAGNAHERPGPQSDLPDPFDGRP